MTADLIDGLSKVETTINYRRKSVNNSHLNDVMQSSAALSNYEKFKSQQNSNFLPFALLTIEFRYVMQSNFIKLIISCKIKRAWFL